MAKTVVFNEKDPQVSIVLEDSATGGLRGACTECGWPMHRWTLYFAVQAAQRHVDSHEPVIIGGDRDSLVR